MNEMTVFVSVVFGGLLLWLVIGRERRPRYRKKAVLTGRERDFFYHLQRALPECIVCPQVAVSALIEPIGIGNTRQAALNHIIGKRVGYAVFDERMQLLVVVELDHRSRRSREEVARDAYFAGAGMPTVRFQARHWPSETKIRGSVYARQDMLPGGRMDPASLHDLGEIEFSRPKTPWRNTANVHI